MKLKIISPEMHEPRRPMGLGDAVAAVAQPTAKAIDAVLGTNLQNCTGCSQRKNNWNKAVPDLLHPFAHGPR
jgi:hypothetical protein